jgi:diguanylate cyclase (GGDEF)-like protein
MTDQFENILVNKLLTLSQNVKKVIDVEIFMENILYKLNELTPLTPFAILLEGSGKYPIRELVFHDIGKREKEFLKSIRYKKVSQNEYFNKSLLDTYGSDVVLKGDIEATEKIIDAFTSFNWVMVGRKFIDLKKEKKVKEKLRLFSEGDSLTPEEEDKIITFLDEQINVSTNKFLTSKKIYSEHVDDLTNAVDKIFLDDAIQIEVSLKKAINDHNFSVVAYSIEHLKSIENEFNKVGKNAMLLTSHEILQSVCRRIDVISKLATNEFIVLCPSINSREVMKLSKRITREANRTILELRSKTNDRVEVPLDIKIGIASSDQADPNDILNTALRNMQRS